jgi:ABC-type dipeptide/oligopeptide/nickel transport system permease subunit
MSRKALAYLGTTVVILVALFIGASFLTYYANTIDNIYWHGSPIPPCFINATACGGHLLGSDEVGRDLLARIIVGARTTLGTSLVAVFFELLVAAVLAFCARYGGSIVRYIIARISTAMACLAAWPFLLLAILLSPEWYAKGGGLSLVAIVAIAAAMSWPKMLQVLSSGPQATAIARRVAKDWAVLVLMLETVAFFGFGAQPPTPSWGNMLSNSNQVVNVGWWVAIIPGLCIFFAVLWLEIGARTALRDP